MVIGQMIKEIGHMIGWTIQMTYKKILIQILIVLMTNF